LFDPHPLTESHRQGIGKLLAPLQWLPLKWPTMLSALRTLFSTLHSAFDCHLEPLFCTCVVHLRILVSIFQSFICFSLFAAIIVHGKEELSMTFIVVY